jgi:eukaryotic-like serine/threonine-protein kinase
MSSAIKNNPATQIVGLLLLLLCCLRETHADVSEQWTYQLDEPIHLSPLITSQAIIVSTAKGRVFALDIDTGTLKWSLDKKGRFWDRSLLADESRLYVGRSGGLLQAYSLATGTLLWSIDIAVNVQVRPLRVGDILYIPTTHVGADITSMPENKAKLLAVDRNNGDILWSRSTSNYALQRPAYNGKAIFVAGSYYDPSIEVEEGGPMRVSSYSPDGKLLWEYQGLDGFTKSIYANENVVAYVGYQDYINALNVDDGTPRWRHDTGNWTPSLIGNQGVIYYGSATTFVYAAESDDGHILWKFNIGGGSFNYLLGEPVISDERIYFLTQKGDIYALDLQTGEKIWMESTKVDARTGLSVNGNLLATGSIDGSVRVYRLQ